VRSLKEIKSESDFFQRVKQRTLGVIGWERVEPSNESGFPDAHFVSVEKSPLGSVAWEGTVEFKHAKRRAAPDLSSDMLRGTQKSALIEYYQMGGRRRWVLCYAPKEGTAWLYDTVTACQAIRGLTKEPTARLELESEHFALDLASWLR
jgi:hypothetical protein